MRILHVISSIDPSRGGPTTALSGMIEAQIAAGLEAGLAATFDHAFDSRIADQLRDRGAEVYLFGPMSERFRGRRDVTDSLVNVIAHYDIVHIHALWEEIQHRAAVIARKLDKPYIMTPHGMLDPWCLDQSRLKKQMYLALRLRRDLQRASAIWYTTETERRLTETLKLRPPALVETLGLDLSEFASLPARGRFRRQHPERIGERPMVLFLSRIHHKKGLDLLVPAFAKVAEKHPDVVLVIAGPDSPDGYRAKVQAMLDEHNVVDRCVFTGMLYCSARIEAMVDADLFVLPSYQENFGIVVIEAMAAGTPVVISDQVNMHEDVLRANTGVVISTEVEQLVCELDHWLADKELRAAAAARCRPFVWENYDWKKIGERWTRHYARVLEPRT